MTDSDNTSVYKNVAPSKLRFHDALMVGLTRFVKKIGGKGAAADALGFTSPALDKVYAGGSISLQRAFDALAHDGHFLDDICALYGRRIVPADAVCTSDKQHSGAIVAGLHKVIEAEADGLKDHAELLAMEPEIRATRKACDEIIGRIDEIRGVVSVPHSGSAVA